jgi:N-acyl-D-amino-acid deacylase
MLDLLITGGRIFDGTGNLWFHGDVGVKDGRITVIPGRAGLIPAQRVIEASGLIVCPGFIDMHAHSGLGVYGEFMHQVSLADGVTTELVGVDGISYAPLPNSTDITSLNHMIGNLNGKSPERVTWTTVREYLKILDTSSSSNKAMVIGNAALRLSALGWETHSPTFLELARMKELLLQSMHDGALGLSSGLTFPPSRYASWRELVELCRSVREKGGIYVTHLRADRRSSPQAVLREAIGIGSRTGVAIHISHLHVGAEGEVASVLEIVDTARERGIDVTFDISDYPYTNGPLASLLPDWILNEGPMEVIKRLKHRSYRNRLFSDPVLRQRDFSRILITGFTRPSHRRLEGASMTAIAHAFGKPVLETLCYLLAAEELKLRYVGLRKTDSFNELLRHPVSIVSSGGFLAGSHSAQARRGSYSRILGRMVGDKSVLNLAEVIRKMTSFPAQRLGLLDRGLIRIGYHADLVIFDPGKARSFMTSHANLEDSPLVQYVVINGKLVVDQGQASDIKAGRVIYGHNNRLGQADDARLVDNGGGEDYRT